MQKVKLLDTGKIVEVTNNVAHGLIDSGKAILLYTDKMMRVGKKSRKRKKGYKIKDGS